MSKPMSKTKSLIRHTKKRFIQRHELEINNRDIIQIVQDIRAGKAEKIETQSNRVSIWDIKIQGSTYRVLYDSTRKTLITTLPKEARYAV